MANFAEKAFKDAEVFSEEQEFQAYRKVIVGNIDNICSFAGEMVGLDKMAKVSGLVIRGGCAEVLAEFVCTIGAICFRKGYQEGRMAQ